MAGDALCVGARYAVSMPHLLADVLVQALTNSILGRELQSQFVCQESCQRERLVIETGNTCQVRLGGSEVVLQAVEARARAIQVHQYFMFGGVELPHRPFPLALCREEQGVGPAAAFDPFDVVRRGSNNENGVVIPHE